MKHLYLDVKIGLKKNKTEWLTGSVDNVAPINNIASSIIKKMTLRLGSTTMDSNYHYLKSYITDLYSYDSQQKASYLQTAGWYVLILASSFFLSRAT